MEHTMNEDGEQLIKVTPLIKLTDVGLTRQDISLAKIKSTSSRCICCCTNSTIKLVTDPESYEFFLDKNVLDHFKSAQVNENMKYIALSNEAKLIIIDLVDELRCDYANKVSEINLMAHNLTMDDVIYWQWIDEVTLGLVTPYQVYTCCMTQPQINHFARSAITNKPRLINIKKEFDCDFKLTQFSQITGIHRDVSCNIYAVSGWANNQEYRKSDCSAGSRQLTSNRFSFMTNDSLENNSYQTDLSELPGDEICGLVQIHCCLRNRSQLIEAHAVAFSSPIARYKSKNKDHPVGCPPNTNHTTLIAANKIGDSIKFYFIDMPTTKGTMCHHDPTQTVKMDGGHSEDDDVPMSIVCVRQNELNLAYLITKYGQLFVCDITNSDVLFQVSVTSDSICCTVAEKSGQGILIVAGDGKVLLIEVILNKLLSYLAGKSRNKQLERTLLRALDMAGVNNHRLKTEFNDLREKRPLNKSMDARLDCPDDEVESTKL